MQGPDAQYEFILESSTGADEAFINHDTATILEIYTANLYTRHTYNHKHCMRHTINHAPNSGVSPVNQFYNVQFTLVARWLFMIIDVHLFVNLV